MKFDVYKLKNSFLLLKNKFEDKWKEIEKKVMKSEFEQFKWFILIFLFVYVFLSGIVYLIPEIIIQGFVGFFVRTILSLQGIETILLEGSPFSFIAGGKKIIISLLCAGVLEIIILLGAILATFGVGVREKIIGGILAILSGFLFNILRIVITINIILTSEKEVFELAHDVLFRITLFLYITIFYVIWFYWRMKKK